MVGVQQIVRSGPDTCLYDLPRLDEELKAQSSRLFVSEEDTCLQVIEPNGSSSTVLESYSELEAYLQNVRTEAGSRIIYVPQPSSVDPLAISESGMKRLISKFDIFPPFLDLLACFGDKPVHAPRSSVPCHVWRDSLASLSKTYYLLKHVQRHGRKDGADSWSIRQMGIYLQVQNHIDMKTMIVLNPSMPFQQRLLRARKLQALEMTDVETLLFSECTRNWNEYLDDLEMRMHEKVSSALVCPSELESHGAPLSIETEVSSVDITTLSYIGQRLESVHRAIASNLAAVEQRQDAFGGNTIQRSSSLRTDLNGLLSRTKDLRSKLEATLNLVSRMLDMSNAQRSTALAHRAAKDSQILKMIAILTLLYLPASFVSTLLSMGYLHVPSTHPFTIVVDNGFIVFVILTVTLLAFTFSIWICFECVRRRKKGFIRRRCGR